MASILVRIMASIMANSWASTTVSWQIEEKVLR